MLIDWPLYDLNEEIDRCICLQFKNKGYEEATEITHLPGKDNRPGFGMA